MSIDIEHDARTQNLLSPAGFLPLVFKRVETCMDVKSGDSSALLERTFPYKFSDLCLKGGALPSPATKAKFSTAHGSLLQQLLQNETDNQIHIKVFVSAKRGICASWGATANLSDLRSRSTSGRTAFQPEGCDKYRFVKEGNLLAARCALLAWLASSMNLRWLIEQPEGSILPKLRCFDELYGWIPVPLN